MNRFAVMLVFSGLLAPVAVSTPALAVDDAAVFRACANGSHPELESCHRVCAIANKANFADVMSNAARSTCEYTLRSKDAKTLMSGTKQCGAKSCVYKLTKTNGSFQGAGYSVSYSFNGNGNDVRIVDPKGRVTMYDQCGTCRTMDYDSGPLKDATIRPGGGNQVVLTLPR